MGGRNWSHFQTVDDVTEFLPIGAIAPDAVDALLDRAFGADRRERTAYRVRAGTQPIEALCAAAVAADGTLIGTIQAWPVALETVDGLSIPMVMVGPVAVEPSHQQGGVGRALMRHLLHAAARLDEPGAEALMLIGDPEYYGRFFDFTADHTGGWRLPGPYEQRRLLARGARVPAMDGVVGPRQGG